MPDHATRETESPAVARVTNVVVACWGVAAQYMIVRSMFVSHQMRYGFGAPIPLFIVWATLERKRWGRLAVVVISLTAVAMFIGVAFLAFGLNLGVVMGHPSSPANMLAWFRNFYSQDSTTLAVVILLAIATGFWMCRAVVVAEFNKGKKNALAFGQWLIALALAVAYTATLFLSLRK